MCPLEEVAAFLIECENSNEDEKTPLEMATFSGRIDAVRYLLLHAKYDRDADRGLLNLAVAGNHLQIVEILLEHNVRTDLEGSGGLTPIDMAIDRGYHKISHLLLPHSPAPNKALLLDQAVEKRRVLATLALIAMGDKDAFKSAPPLHVACSKNRPEIVQFLLHNKDSVNQYDIWGNTPLHCACSSEDNEEVVKLLLSHGASVCAINRDGMTPLLQAKSPIVQEILIESDADPNITDNDGKTALHNVTSVESAIFLLKRNVLVDARDKFGNTPLFTICKRGNVGIAETLLDYGAALNTRNQRGESLLHVTVECNSSARMVEFLIERGVEVNARDNSGNNPLHRAVETRRLVAIQALLANGVQVSARGKDGNTALHVAVKADVMKIVQMLVNHAAHMNVVNDMGETPLHVCYSKNMAEFLLKKGANGAIRDNLGRIAHILVDSDPDYSSSSD